MQSKWLLLLPQVALFSVISLQLAPRVADCSNNTTIRCIDEEREALLSFKQSLVDEHGFLSSWGSEDNKSDCCEWIGVYCRNKTHHVYALDLQDGSLKLKGTILSPSLRKLQHLTYLDLSDNDFSGIPIADFIGSLSSKLRHLDLGWAGFAGSVPPQLGNLSNLQYLNLGYNDLLSVGNLLHWLYHLSSLRYLHLGHNNLSNSNDWPLVVYKLSSLTTLILEGCDLPPFFPSADDPLHLNSSKSLEFLDLSENNLTSSVYPWLFNVSSNLVELGLSSNLLQGSIPDAFEHMVSLQTLFLYSNELEGGIPKFFGNMCCLNELVLCSNQLTGQLFEFIQNLSCGCAKNSLESLDLSANAVTGPIPELGGLSSLKSLYLGGNRLNGTINQSLGRMYKLEKLSLGGNSLTGVISEDFFSNTSNLKVLKLGHNSFTLKFRHDWIPPFQLNIIKLNSCKMGRHFPKWFQTQNQIDWLDISNTGISDTIPDWFWDLSRKKLSFLNLSNNQIKGKLPDLSLRFDTYGPCIDISSNHFEGPIPPLPSNASVLNLSKNKFSGSISFLCSISGHKLMYLDLSNNLLSGRLPDCWLLFDRLGILDLANNNFSGKIPDSMGSLPNIQILSLHNNRLTGELPSTLQNCLLLKLMDLGRNALSGEIPTWIGESLPKLIVLSLMSNKFHGIIPFQLCHLPFIQILDLSSNNIPGIIPKCFNNFTAMAQEKSSVLSVTSNYSFISDGGFPLVWYDNSYFGQAELTWKGSQYKYQNTLGLVKMLDLSSNKLGGEVPEEIMDLVGLIAMNLSRNNLTGQITPKISQLKSLDFLDLSRNRFFGGIPSSLSQLSGLSVMDLSYNNLSGKIPSGTQLQSFNASTYAGNELCGLPLPNKCPDEDLAPRPGKDDANTPEEEDQFITLGFYVSLILGFFVGFWGFCGTLLVKSSWRHRYYNFLTGIENWFYVTAVVNIAKLQRRLRS
ncbi:hypothetical protein KPL71_025371 [Citrus sinensis]|uniref:Uncharacterized protein n=1 Tax=Citrus sinensis TaxID=2711 RepID=A0ACB8HRP3_CITSI|nr:hypothetical protein KPL71_025371 [Citrus sinensis]